MSNRLPSRIVNDILSCIGHLQHYTANLSFNDIKGNFMVVEACLYNIHIIGEAVTQLDEDIKLSEPHVPWVLIKGMRNRLIHEYFGTDLAIVWNVIKVERPGFKSNLENLYQRLTDKGR